MVDSSKARATSSNPRASQPSTPPKPERGITDTHTHEHLRTRTRTHAQSHLHIPTQTCASSTAQMSTTWPSNANADTAVHACARSFNASSARSFVR
eukprot:14273401-Alexandrium_andersonii.AAC.1